MSQSKTCKIQTLQINCIFSVSLTHRHIQSLNSLSRSGFYILIQQLVTFICSSRSLSHTFVSSVVLRPVSVLHDGKILTFYVGDLILESPTLFVHFSIYLTILIPFLLVNFIWTNLLRLTSFSLPFILSFKLSFGSYSSRLYVDQS